jgi:mycofactocin system glycosyltransferase
MSDQAPKGCFKLQSGIRLIRAAGGGVILQSNPLRVLKINGAAMDLLEKCRTGFEPDQEKSGSDWHTAAGFLDTLVQGGLLEWTPPPPKVLPRVSVVIPVYNRPAEIEACLASLQTLDYPHDKLEVIVVDDASQDQTAAVVRRWGVHLVIQARNRGQSAARNAGVAAAKGEIIAFLDSDCIAQPGWLRELVPYFQDPRVALVGGYVDSYYREKRMDRYEQACSALNMGPDPVMGRGTNSVFYVPTCNLLVRRECYAQVGGLDECLQVGEDVDLCWRFMAKNHHLLYIPRGAVLHKHRNKLLSGFLRRFDYGTSEAVLYSRFPKVVKQFPWQTAGLGMILVLAASLAARSWYGALLAVVMLAVEIGFKRLQLIRKMDIRLPVAEIFKAVMKSHFQLAYYLAFYMVRYHLLLIIALSFALPSLVWLWLGVILGPTLVAYLQKRPQLSFPVFAFFYLAEHAFYQSGAFWGCLKQANFRLYRISFRYAGFMAKSSRNAAGHHVALKKTPKGAVTGTT